MLNVGRFNQLTVIKIVPFGVYLDGGEWGEILLPNKVVPSDTKINDVLDVFIYFDSSDKVIATTQRPRIQLGQCAFLKVIDVNAVGAFLDWGLDKDLLVPRPEQQRPMEKDKSYIVYVKQDYQGRLIASAKLDYFLSKTTVIFKPGDEVNLLIAETTALGNKVIINHEHWGLIHEADIFQSLRYGQKLRGYIKKVRDDGKIDVWFRKPGQANTHDLASRILIALEQSNGFLPLHDKSLPEEITRVFNESKKSFKNAIGQLYKQGKIDLEEHGIRLR